MPSEENRFLRTLLAFVLGILAGALCAAVVFLATVNLRKGSREDECLVAGLEAAGPPPEPC